MLPPFTQDQEAEFVSCFASLPSPARVAMSLPECALMALIHAEQGMHGQFRLRHGVRHMEAGQILFSAGLVEAGGPYLGNFGMRVRREAILMSQEGEL